MFEVHNREFSFPTSPWLPMVFGKFKIMIWPLYCNNCLPISDRQLGRHIAPFRPQSCFIPWHIFHYSLKLKTGWPVVLRERPFQLAFVANKRLSLCIVSQKNWFAFCLTEVVATNPVNKNCLVIASSTDTLRFHFAEGLAKYQNCSLACFCRRGEGGLPCHMALGTAATHKPFTFSLLTCKLNHILMQT